jgi:preprotein translocase subunit YajC
MSEGLSGQLPFLLLMLVVFFFFIILPQQRRQKKEKNFMRDMKKGDRIITKSGIHGKIMDLNDKDNTCIVETMAGKLKIERSAISLEMSSKLNAPSAKKLFTLPLYLAGYFLICIRN